MSKSFLMVKYFLLINLLIFTGCSDKSTTIVNKLLPDEVNVSNIMLEPIFINGYSRYYLFFKDSLDTSKTVYNKSGLMLSSTQKNYFSLMYTYLKQPSKDINGNTVADAPDEYYYLISYYSYTLVDGVLKVNFESSSCNNINLFETELTSNMIVQETNEGSLFLFDLNINENSITPKLTFTRMNDEELDAYEKSKFFKIESCDLAMLQRLGLK